MCLVVLALCKEILRPSNVFCKQFNWLMVLQSIQEAWHQHGLRELLLMAGGEEGVGSSHGESRSKREKEGQVLHTFFFETESHSVARLKCSGMISGHRNFCLQDSSFSCLSFPSS